MSEETPHTHHALDYIEFGVTDLLVAKEFYGSAFGWIFNDYGPGPAYVGIRRSGAAEGVEVGGFRLDADVKPGGRRFHFRDPSGNELGVWSES